MKRMNVSKYRPYPYAAPGMASRSWPDKTITKAPRWCSVDLRDGNQALAVPMSIEDKLTMFDFLVRMGFKEIEIGFPSASAIEFDFTRRLIDERRIPADVTIQVLTQAREHLIKRSFEAVAGAKDVIIHLYNSVSAAQREIVFAKSKEEIKAIAVDGAKLVKQCAAAGGIGSVTLEYSPESFTGTENDYALEVCHAVMGVWQPSPERRIILNLPSTIEMSTPNVYADRIEWFCRNMKDRGSVVVSVHTHNDRGTAVAAAELAVLAGADRVEGSLFGNGERTGNMDIVTMAMNLFSQGVDPELDLSDIDAVREMYKCTTRMDVPPRHPYAGELVFTAFSGSHQDAINKGMKATIRNGGTWNVPYLPIDPQDVGRTYESIIRINSQSGKGGIAYVMENEFGMLIPKWMQPDLGRVVQVVADTTGRELTADEIIACFMKEYVHRAEPYRLEKCHIDMDDDEDFPEKANRATVTATVRMAGKDVSFTAAGNGPIDAFVKGMQESTGIKFSLTQYAEHALAQGADSNAVAYVGIRHADGRESCGVGIDTNIGIASIKAVLGCLNRH